MPPLRTMPQHIIPCLLFYSLIPKIIPIILVLIVVVMVYVGLPS